MVRTRDFLARFRPVGTPGAAATAGVPVDRVRELTAELEPLLDSLADTQARAGAIRAEGDAEAGRRRHDGQARAEALLAAGRARAEAMRTATLTTARAEAEAAVSLAVEVARAEAAAIDDRAGQRLPVLVEQLRAAVRAELIDQASP